ncbi:MAG: hypothetical protein JWM32_1591 [Verrucomicrobia bacterium]|nr:hypothetical protein [Verrucomicrobiota bacterium]
MNEPYKPKRTGAIRLSIELPKPAHRAYVGAVALLRRLMGRRAPTVEGLIHLNLSGRDAAGLADDYLDSIHWPAAAGRVVSLRAKEKIPRRTRRLPQPFVRAVAKRARLPQAPSDVTRN